MIEITQIFSLKFDTDIDECVSSPCTAPNASCENNDGGYECKCPDGWKGDGVSIHGCNGESIL